MNQDFVKGSPKNAPRLRQLFPLFSEPPHPSPRTPLPPSRFARKSAETFSLRKILSPWKLDEKGGILRCERMDTIIHFRKFIIQKNKRLNTRLKKPNCESSLVPNVL